MSTKHTIACPQCGKQLTVTSEMQGRTGKCKGCGGTIVIQIPVAPAASEEDEFQLKPLDAPAPVHMPSRAALTPTATAPRPAKTSSVIAEKSPGSSPPKVPSPALAIAAMLGRGTLLLVGLIVVVVVAWRFMAAGPANGPNAGGGAQGGANNVALVVEYPATIKREPQPGPNSWVTSRGLKPLDAAKWKVTAEEVAPLPKDALDLIPFQDIYNTVRHGEVFSDSSGAKFGTLHSNYKDYDKGDYRTLMRLNLYDLRQLDPKVVELGIHEMSPDKEPLVRAMSPGGGQVAYIHTAPAERGYIYVFDTEGKPIAKVAVPDVDYEHQVKRIWFAGETRLLVQTDKWLKAYELPSGTEAWTFANKLDTPLQFTRGRKWFSVFHGDRFAFYSTTDGTLAGEIPLPEHWQSKDPILFSAIAFHHDGKRMATFCLSPKQDVLVTSWDIAAGKPLEQFEMPGRDFEYEKINYHGAVWISDRRIVAGSGQIIDFDHHTYILKIPESYSPRPEHSYDGRLWLAGYPGEENQAKLDAKYGKPNVSYLFASTVPSKAKEEEFAQTKQKLLLYPGCSLGITCADSVPAEYRAKYITAYADALATRGVRVDQQAKLKVQLHSAEVRIAPNVARILNMPNAPKERHWHGILYGELVDENGKQFGSMYGCMTEFEGKKEDTWDAIAREFANSASCPRFLRWVENPTASGTVQQPLPEDKLTVDALERM